MATRPPGSAGGTATLKRHGIEHFREIGRRGFAALKDRYFSGDGAEAMDWLRSRRNELQIAGLVDEKLDRQIAAGATVASEEIPVIADMDADPFYKDGDYWTRKVGSERGGRNRHETKPGPATTSRAVNT